MKKSSGTSQPFLLAVQTLIVGEKGSYHDYRDYIFSLVSSSFLKNSVVRINIERGGEYVDEIQQAITSEGFKDAEISSRKPESWSQYLIDCIDEVDPVWTMLFPGDHIFVNANQDKLLWYLHEADKYNADAVSYGHVQDWDFLVDWQRVKIIEDNDEYAVIEWGWRRRYARNKTVGDGILNELGRQVVITPVPGYMVFRSKWLKDVLSAIPDATRWHDIEHARHPKTLVYKILIPKRHLYRHVHGYWLEHYFETLQGKTTGGLSGEQVLDDMYIRPNYDWYTGKPSPLEYFRQCEERYPYLSRYRGEKYVSNVDDLPATTFLQSSQVERGLFRRLLNIVLNLRDDIRYFTLSSLRLLKIR